MNRVQMELTIKRVSIVLAAVTILTAAPALSQAPNQTGQPCPGTATVGAGEQASNSADNPASQQVLWWAVLRAISPDIMD